MDCDGPSNLWDFEEQDGVFVRAVVNGDEVWWDLVSFVGSCGISV